LDAKDQNIVCEAQPFLGRLYTATVEYTRVYLPVDGKIFPHMLLSPKPLIQHIGDYDMADLQQRYSKYVHKRTKHLLL
jgi:hypothetical protein